MGNTIVISRIGNHEINGKVTKQRRVIMSEDTKKEESVNDALDSGFVEDVPEVKEVEDIPDDMPDFLDLPDMQEAAEKAEKYGVIEDDKQGKCSVRMAFVGAGQGGSNLADHFWALGYRRVLVINTSSQDMKALKINKANQYVMEGYDGAGKNPKVGLDAAKKNYENILRRFHKCLGKNVEHIMLCIGSGGGTGTGSAEVLVNIAQDYFKELGIDGRIGLIVTTPDKTEKGAVQANASILIRNLIKRVDAKEISPLVIVDNEQIGKFFPNESIANFYPKSNQIVCGLFDRFNVITAYGSPIGYNVDGADYRELLAGGLMTYGQCKVKEIKDDTTLAEAMVKNVKNTLLCPGFDLATATNACCLIMADDEQLANITKDAVNKAVESLSRVFTNGNVKIHLGIYKAHHKGVSIVTAVSGVSEPKEKLDKMRKHG